MSDSLLKCTRPGCGKSYNPETANPNACTYHPGRPLFHEGLKSWDCCSDMPDHRPVLDFDDFMKIPGCTTGKHITEVKQTPPPVAASPNQVHQASTPTVTVSTTSDGKEVYTTGAASTSAPASKPISRTQSPAPPLKVEEDEDDPAVEVSAGTECQRNGCKVAFVSNEENREGDGEGAQCQYHPMAPIFHEGSKGYLCCKPRVLEFDEFLKIPGCKSGKHVFAKKQKENAPKEELVKPRIDHYQTPTHVHVSVFAKQVDGSKSTVQFDREEVHLDLYLPAGKRCLQSLNLWNSINPTESSFKVYGTKVEITLIKDPAVSWTLLEKTAAELPPGYGFTFSAGGRTGTIGGKDAVLAPNNVVQ